MKRFLKLWEKKPSYRSKNLDVWLAKAFSHETYVIDGKTDIVILIHVSFNRFSHCEISDDSTRVLLDSGTDGDYINASYVSVPVAPSRKYILTQGPMQQTASHFWLMVWERRSPAIVMLNRIFEKGTMKCHPYFPDENFRSTLMFEDINLCVELKEEVVHRNFAKRVLDVRNTQVSSVCSLNAPRYFMSSKSNQPHGHM
ncbi:unnamed protein product [Echinostoma caproni]|uniref:protein-tyrosine-phosphatase n=1 Tax=Echinostoma caproni TaxID=27848 RepID=A0A3P8GYY0_9TREM|nr:unnamed protein product [Echinostoma caproni]